jgi:hypothetical protein
MTSPLGLDLALLLGQSIGMPRVPYPAMRAKEKFEESILQQPYSAAACTPLPTCRSTPAGGRWGGSWACRGPHKAVTRAVSWSIPEAHHIRTPTNTQAGVLASLVPSGHVPLLPPQSPRATLCERFRAELSRVATRIRAVVGGDGLAHFTGTAGGPVAMLGANAAANYDRAGSYPWIYARLTTHGW